MCGLAGEGASRLLGSGYEPHVDAIDGRLVYSLPVESGFLTRGFSFDIEQLDFTVLLDDPYRRAVLECIVHAVLQRSMIPDYRPVTQADFSLLVTEILHGTRAELERLIATVDREHNIGVHFYVDAIMARRKAEQIRAGDW